MTHNIEKFIINKIKFAIEKFNLHNIKLNYINEEKDYWVIHLLGGENGHGRFSNYLEDVKHIINQFDNTWLIEWTNDCLDDFWKLTFAIKIM